MFPRDLGVSCGWVCWVFFVTCPCRDQEEALRATLCFLSCNFLTSVEELFCFASLSFLADEPLQRLLAQALLQLDTLYLVFPSRLQSENAKALDVFSCIIFEVAFSLSL